MFEDLHLQLISSVIHVSDLIRRYISWSFQPYAELVKFWNKTELLGPCCSSHRLLDCKWKYVIVYPGIFMEMDSMDPSRTSFLNGVVMSKICKCFDTHCAPLSLPLWFLSLPDRLRLAVLWQIGMNGNQKSLLIRSNCTIFQRFKQQSPGRTTTIKPWYLRIKTAKPESLQQQPYRTHTFEYFYVLGQSCHSVSIHIILYFSFPIAGHEPRSYRATTFSVLTFDKNGWRDQFRTS